MSNSLTGEDQIWLFGNQQAHSPHQRRSSGFESIWNQSGISGGGLNRSGSIEENSTVTSEGNPSVAGSNGGNIWGAQQGNRLYAEGMVEPRNPFELNPYGGSALEGGASLDMDRLGNLDIGLRRHSYGDVFAQKRAHAFRNGSTPITQPQVRANSNAASQERNLDLVNDYFEKDHHQRVKVTAQFLAERFAEEGSLLRECTQLPNFPIEQTLSNYRLVLVGFKAGRIDVFYIPNEELSNLRVNDLVIVEADRGKDLGKIFRLEVSIEEARMMKLLQMREQQAALSEVDSSLELSIRNIINSGGISGTSTTLHYPKPIIGLALGNDIIQILNKKQDEEKACRLCWAKIASTTQGGTSGESPTSPRLSNSIDLLQLRLIDAEYQFDRKKLIFYYSTHKRIDFRDLVRELFRIYKTRIWMCAVIGIPYMPNVDSNHASTETNTSSNGNIHDSSPLLTKPTPYNGQFTSSAFSGNYFNPGMRSNSLLEQQYGAVTPQTAPAPLSNPPGNQFSGLWGRESLSGILTNHVQGHLPGFIPPGEVLSQQLNFGAPPLLNDPFKSASLGRPMRASVDVMQAPALCKNAYGSNGHQQNQGSVPRKFL